MSAITEPCPCKGPDGPHEMVDSRCSLYKSFVCTANRPWSEDVSRTATHPHAPFERDTEHDGGDCSVHRCPNCRLTFHQELPD